MAGKHTVLVADDDQVFQELISDALKHEGYSVIQAYDGGAAIDLALKHQPDFIILDIRMPTSQGLEVVRQLREDPWGKEVPILVLTEVEDVDSVSTAISQGVMWYEVKTNLSIGEVVERVNSLFNVKDN